MKVIISTGLGRLHLVQSAQHLKAAGVDTELIQGWIPRRLPDGIVDLLGGALGRKSLSVGMRKREAPFLHEDRNHDCGWSEFYAQGLMLLSRSNLLSQGRAAELGWKAFGKASRKFLVDQSVFHVRSGAGRGGAIKTARERGLKVIVDHSIAHPAFMRRALQPEFDRAEIPFSLGDNDPFWKTVLSDCVEGDLLLVNSDFVKETFVDEGFPEEKIAVAYLGVREDFFHLKRSYAVSGSINLLFTGSFDLRKGAQYLLPAAAELIRSGLPVRLKVVGTVHQSRRILKEIDPASFEMLGHLPQDQLKEHLSLADIYVFPSLAEGCASSGMEAMAAGLPVIATRESGLPIRHGENGVLIASKSVEAIIDAVTLLARDRRLREQLGREAAKTISEVFTWDKYAQNVMKVYGQLFEQS
jgi:glycosyltransferase involved in cell wall biosynthesis